MKRSSEQISEIMRRVASRNTEPEQILRKALHAKGLRFARKLDTIVGKPDILLPKYRLAIFVDGDLWHGHQWAVRGLSSLDEQFSTAKNREYWLSKIRRNMVRDAETTCNLLDDGWKVLRLWESEIHGNLEECVSMAISAIKSKGRDKGLALLPQRTVAEYFAGIGLMRMGLEQEGWRVTFANDIDQAKAEMYRNHFGDESEFALGDIHELDPSSLEPTTIATASFPCNDLSLAGARRGLHGNQSSAFWGFMRIIESLQHEKPPIILLENVVGFLSSKKGEDFSAACRALNAAGYTVDPFILDAIHFVPQSRKRLFMVCVRKAIQNPEAVRDEESFYQSALRPRQLANFIFDHPEIEWSIRNLPAPPKLETDLPRILEELEEDAPEWWNKKRAKYLLEQMNPSHRQIADKMIKGRKLTFGTVFRRIRNGKSMAELRTDGIAGCLRTPRGGSARQILFVAGKGEYRVRLLTARECARLMGADEYKIDATLNKALFGFGDAVCVPAVAWIAKYYLNPLLNELLRGKAFTPESLSA